LAILKQQLQYFHPSSRAENVLQVQGCFTVSEKEVCEGLVSAQKTGENEGNARSGDVFCWGKQDSQTPE